MRPNRARQRGSGDALQCILIIAIGCILGLLVAAIAVYQHMQRAQLQPIHDQSKMISVRAIMGGALAMHYEQHNSYPRRLSDLPLRTLQWGEWGSSARDLNRWDYSSDGTSFSMTWTNARGNELFLGGKTGEVHYSLSAGTQNRSGRGR